MQSLVIFTNPEILMETVFKVAELVPVQIGKNLLIIEEDDYLSLPDNLVQALGVCSALKELDLR